MSLQLTSKAELVKRVGAADRLDNYAQHSDANITEAIEVASDMFRSAASNRYTTASIDDLTVETLSPEPKYHIESLALSVLVGDSTDDYKDAADRAQKYLSWVAAGKTSITGLTARGIATSGNTGVRYRGRTTGSSFGKGSDPHDYRDPDI